MDSEICLHNANLLTGYSVMNNCAVLLKSYKIIDVFNETRFAKKKFFTRRPFYRHAGCQHRTGLY